MSHKEKVFIPQTGGGIVRYSEDDHYGLKLQPEHVVAFTVLVILGEILLHTA